MDLPLEICEMILRYYFPPHIATRPLLLKRRHGSIPGIFLAAKQISTEATTVLNREVPFLVAISPFPLEIRFCNQTFGIPRHDTVLSNYELYHHTYISNAFSAITKRIRKFDIVIELDCFIFQGPLDDHLLKRLRNGISSFLELIGLDPSDTQTKFKTINVSFKTTCESDWHMLGSDSAIVQIAQEVVDGFQRFKDGSVYLSFSSFHVDAYIWAEEDRIRKRVRYNIQKGEDKWVVRDGLSSADYEDLPVLLGG
jgi:hypothetical protein